MGISIRDVTINGRRYKALIDTGYNGRLLVNKRVAEELSLPIIGELERTTVDGRRVKVKVSYARVGLEEGEETHATIEILDELPLDALVGVIALKEMGYVVDPTTGTIKKVGLLAV